MRYGDASESSPAASLAWNVRFKPPERTGAQLAKNRAGTCQQGIKNHPKRTVHAGGE